MQLRDISPHVVVADVFQTLIENGCRETGLSREEWVLSALKTELHCHATLLNAVIPGLHLSAYLCLLS